MLIVLSVLLLRLRSSERRLLWLWAPAPIVGILAIAGMDLATSDASAAGQVFLCYPVIYAASQLKPPAAITACVAAVIADAVVVLSLRPLTPALTDLCYVSAALLSMTALLIRAGKRQDELVLELRRQAAVDPLTGWPPAACWTTPSGRPSPATTAAVAPPWGWWTSTGSRRSTTAMAIPSAMPRSSTSRRSSPRTPGRTRSCVASGGDEIAFLLPGCPLEVALQRAEYLVRAIRETPMRLPGGERLHLSVSIGVAHAPLPHDDETLRGLYAEADAALYNAKRAGRDRVGVPAGLPRGATATQCVSADYSVVIAFSTLSLAARRAGQSAARTPMIEPITK